MSVDVVPDGVVDIEFYEKYLKERELLDDEEETTYYSNSDPNTSVNLLSGMYFLEKAIAHLPENEQEEVRLKAKKIHSAKGRASQYKKRAFGATNENGAHILDSKKAELIELFGRFHNVTEVHQIVTSDWGIQVHIKTVDSFRIKYLERIKERQEEYKREFSDLRLGYKRSRLDELTYLYNSRKLRYKASQSREDYKLLLQTLDQIKKEVEGDRIVIDGNLSIDIEMTVNDHIQNEILSQLVVTDLIVARVAAKSGLDARFLMAKLRASHYAKFAGFIKPDISLMDDEMIYPSQLVYNFEEIERKHRHGLIDEAKVIEPNEEKISVGKSLRDQILQKISERRRGVETEITLVDQYVRKEESDPEESPKSKKKEFKKKKRK